MLEASARMLWDLSRKRPDSGGIDRDLTRMLWGSRLNQKDSALNQKALALNGKELGGNL
jgi:hypothetical protein